MNTNAFGEQDHLTQVLPLSFPRQRTQAKGWA